MIVTAPERAARFAASTLVSIPPRPIALPAPPAIASSAGSPARAVRAVTHDGKSLLPIGVVSVTGTFGRGEVVGCFAPDGREVARGLVNYASQDAARIVRRPSSEIEAILGYVDEPELIHRDNLVLLG
jgi:glutamate 5-kinase